MKFNWKQGFHQSVWFDESGIYKIRKIHKKKPVFGDHLRPFWLELWVKNEKEFKMVDFQFPDRLQIECWIRGYWEGADGSIIIDRFEETGGE